MIPLNDKSNTFYFIVVICVFIAGIFVGLFWSDITVYFQWKPEFSIGDAISIAAILITFIFAYKGLADNRVQYLNSISPILDQYIDTNSENGTLEIKILNAGNGTAFLSKREIYLEGKRLNNLHDVLAHLKIIFELNDQCLARKNDVIYILPHKEVCILSITTKGSDKHKLINIENYLIQFLTIKHICKSTEF